MHSECAHAWTFLTDLWEAIALIENLSHSHLKIAFDTYYFGGDERVVQGIKGLAPHLGIVHLADARHLPDGEQERCPLGSGIVPLGEIIAGLAEAGYDGYFDIKLMGQEIEAADYRELLRQSRLTVSQLFDATV